MSNTWTTLLDLVYPKETVYQSCNTLLSSPAELFGGTWVQLGPEAGHDGFAGQSMNEVGTSTKKYYNIGKMWYRTA